jgi:valyl-tRNA synthetase
MMTAYDIIFFWVARMVMMGMHFAGGVPFKRIFINGLVRDDKGEKMSKIKGNSIDPLVLIDEHGADALRFTLAALAAPGTDPSLSLARLQGYQAFANKLWNASRFVLMNVEGGEVAKSYDVEQLPLPSRWILGELRRVVGCVKPQFEEFRFDLATNAIYHFIWGQFCDWYLEISKTYLADPERAPETRAVLLNVLETSLRLLHPIMPFITEEIWQRLPHEGESIMVAPFPVADDIPAAPVASEIVMNELFALVTGIRTWRAENGVEPKRRIDATIVAGNLSAQVQENAEWIRSLPRINRLEIVRDSPPDTGDAIKLHIEAWEIHIPKAGLFDVAAEKTRLTKERLKLEQELDGLNRKLDNPQFVERAKPEVVAESRQRAAELVARREKIEATLRDLAGGA